jgi:N-acyl-D-aspartate/D-glutamate deacylase
MYDLKIVGGMLIDGSGQERYASGYVATLVNGEVIAKDGKLTGARPGRLVRAGRFRTSSTP